MPSRCQGLMGSGAAVCPVPPWRAFLCTSAAPFLCPACFAVLCRQRGFPFGVYAGGLGGLAFAGLRCVLLLLFSVLFGLCFGKAFSGSAVFCVGLCCWLGSLRVPLGLLLAFLPLPPFPLSRLFVTTIMETSLRIFVHFLPSLCFIRSSFVVLCFTT
jgi:hypothetical protein